MAKGGEHQFSKFQVSSFLRGFTPRQPTDLSLPNLPTLLLSRLAEISMMVSCAKRSRSLDECYSRE